jgi:hypothetical protein
VNLWPPAVLRDSLDTLTTALKKHFCINGVYANHNHVRRPGIPEWRINSTRVHRIAASGRRDTKIRGSMTIKDQPVLYTYWWLFWAAVHVHRKLPEGFTEQRIREKFEAALQEAAKAANAASHQQAQVTYRETLTASCMMLAACLAAYTCQ